MVLFVGLLVPRKGVDTVIKVAEHFKEEDVKFVLVGDGPNRKEYEAIVKEKGIKNVIFTGWRQDVIDFYKAADVFFFPSKGEGLPGVVMEAMACGLPVVASDIAGNKDLIEDGETGILCGEASIDEYEKGIAELLQNQKTKKKFEIAAPQNIKELGWSKVLESYVGLYEE